MTNTAPVLGQNRGERDAREQLQLLVALVERVRRRGTRSPEEEWTLVAWLAERHSIYAGCSTNQVARLRGYILASFESAGLPDEALPFVLEELETGRDPYVVAAAAKALRGAAAPAAWMSPFLAEAARHIRESDDTFSFETPHATWPPLQPTTAHGELRRTLEWMGETGACCDLPPSIARMFTRIQSIRRLASRDSATNDVVAGGVVRFEDHEGRLLTDTELFIGKPTVSVFFYTRCTNPDKCSLTITSLARLQAALSANGLSQRVRLVAITYDPAYDTPARLLAYTKARGLVCTDDVRVLRAVEGFDTLCDRFDLQLNSTGSIVNTHRIELSITDAKGRIVASLTRLQWDPDDVLRTLLAFERAGQEAQDALHVWLAADAAGTARRLPRARLWLAFPAGIVVAFFPRCPICWTSYLALLGAPGLLALPYSAWWRYGAMAWLIANAGLALAAARRLSVARGGAWALAAGTCLVSAPGLLLSFGVGTETAASTLAILGAGLVATGASLTLWSSRPRRLTTASGDNLLVVERPGLR